MKNTFTAENQLRLEQLLGKMLLTGKTLPLGKMSADSSAETLSQSSITTLRATLRRFKEEAAKISASETDSWSDTTYLSARVSELQTWIELVDLLIGYNLHLEESELRKEKAAKLQMDIAELEEAVLTPAERLEQKKKLLEELVA